ncbi:MAG TPA: 2OG-Fe dioxygenase family protein [Ottowia sp.]|mgnify:CR=1 FL=1|uniref:2OG-Fe dioxygenase family protein n=1 Tax=Ottowia sp. TaxID=1898956 RepID=UPI002C3E9BCE|nr:2OG-Fe dioxygenase family protein [Ottowia sp.]HMN20641.1 2OG-Fe dioxygenase family protein [Ottowia sp.]
MLAAFRCPLPAVFAPPYATAEDLLPLLCTEGFAVLDAATVQRLAGVTGPQLARLQPDWDRLEPDRYLRDGGHYRRRRHASFTVRAGAVHDESRRPHWQPLAYNALHGGLERWFAPVLRGTLAQPAWRGLLAWLAGMADALRGAQPWWGEAHQFRIDTAGGIGRPTPEGAHRDGVDLVAVFLVGCAGIKGGETRVFELDGPRGQRFTLEQPWSLLLLDDQSVIHETTPIQPAAAGVPGHRDTLVVTLRSGGFLAPAA